MTISCRAGVEQAKGKRWACVLCKVLDLFQRGHCAKSVASFDARVVAQDAEIARGEQPL